MLNIITIEVLFKRLLWDVLYLCSPGVLHDLLVDESWADEADQTAHGGSSQTQDGLH